LHPILSRALFIPTFLWNALLGRFLRKRNWWDHIESNLILGAMPLRKDVDKLVAEGVTAVVNMCQEYPGPTDLYAQHHIEQLRLPTVDFNPPSLEHARLGVDFIQKHLSQNGTVYVHCKAGRARSANVLMCFLMAHRNMTIEQAQKFLLSKRPHVNRKLTESPTVLAFADELPKKS
jgi:atypical dual specificity phosphatase